jgi:four helix bundle protein
MTYERFEDLPVWKAAMSLAQAVFDLVEPPAFHRLGDLRNQLQRAALSVPNNIAEGFERGTTAELLTFIYIARGSAGEVRSMLAFAAQRPALAELRPRVLEIVPTAESVSRQLRGWAASLQNSDIAGQRRMTDQTQAEYRQRQRAEEFIQKLAAYRKPPPSTES